MGNTVDLDPHILQCSQSYIISDLLPLSGDFPGCFSRSEGIHGAMEVLPCVVFFFFPVFGVCFHVPSP